MGQQYNDRDDKDSRSRRSDRTPTKSSGASKQAAALDHLVKQRRAREQARDVSSSSESESEEEIIDDDDDYVGKSKSKSRDRDRDRSRSRDRSDKDKSEKPSSISRVENYDEGDGRNSSASLDSTMIGLGPITHAQAVKICIRRYYLEQFATEPWFDELCIGYFIRIGIGQDHTGNPVYRLTQIDGIKDGKEYTLGKHRTKKHLILRFGGLVRSFSMEQVSNHGPTEEEYNKWLREMKSSKTAVMGQEEANEKVKELEESRNHIYTEEEVRAMVKTNQTKYRKVQLQNRRDEARDRRDKAMEEEVLSELAEIEQQERIAWLSKEPDRQTKINQRNLQNNIKTKYERKNPAEISELDPFSRRKTNPGRIYSSQQPLSEEEKKLQAEAAAMKLKKKEEVKIKKVDVEDADEILRNAHDIDIASLSMEIEPARAGPLQPVSKPKDKSKKKRPTISLAEYKRRAGL
eukprot:TRINITY_DN2574_c0_g1_i2.p1 TRINITY_DN2574_c0_g1~~TRINITY_DN2574_c0_g1_i2.p1  ORF type:complete len:540 (-),score=166.98 TRINITY_DN2574_c0_g1_i2:80-1465(-)